MVGLSVILCEVFTSLRRNAVFASNFSVQTSSSLGTDCFNFFYRTELDLIKGVVRNNVEAGVIEPSKSKLKIIQVSCS
jgi:hypothetical protein